MSTPEVERALEVLRQADAPPSPSPAFAARVARRALSERETPAPWDFLPRFALRAALLSAATAVGALAVQAAVDDRSRSGPATDIDSALDDDEPWIGADAVYATLLASEVDEATDGAAPGGTP